MRSIRHVYFALNKPRKLLPFLAPRVSDSEPGSPFFFDFESFFDFDFLMLSVSFMLNPPIASSKFDELALKGSSVVPLLLIWPNPALKAESSKVASKL